jgi:hypothetical protein
MKFFQTILNGSNRILNLASIICFFCGSILSGICLFGAAVFLYRAEKSIYPVVLSS